MPQSRPQQPTFRKGRTDGTHLHTRTRHEIRMSYAQMAWTIACQSLRRMERQMELRVLNYYLAVVREGSITRAAEAAHITQPALSRQLAQLERELGAQLFTRSARGIELTSEGYLLARRAEELVTLAEKTRYEVSHHDRELEGTIHIAGGSLSSERTLATLVRDFRAEHPYVSFEMLSTTSNEITERMDHGLVDIGLLVEPIELERYDHIPVGEEKWVAVLRADDPLADRDFLTPDDLASGPVILPHRATVRNEAANWFGQAFARVDVAATANLVASGTAMVRAGLGRNMCVRDTSLEDPGNEIVAIPLDPSVHVRTLLAWRRDGLLSEPARRFVEFCRGRLLDHPSADGREEPASWPPSTQREDTTTE